MYAGAQAKGITDWLTDLNAQRVQLKPDGEDQPYPDVSASRTLDLAFAGYRAGMRDLRLVLAQCAVFLRGALAGLCRVKCKADDDSAASQGICVLCLLVRTKGTI
jgi:hypothetical protein